MKTEKKAANVLEKKTSEFLSTSTRTAAPAEGPALVADLGPPTDNQHALCWEVCVCEKAESVFLL